MSLRYGTDDGEQRTVNVTRHNGAWVVLDELGEDKRVVEILPVDNDDTRDEAREEADAIAADYAAAAAAAGEPLVSASVGA